MGRLLLVPGKSLLYFPPQEDTIAVCSIAMTRLTWLITSPLRQPLQELQRVMKERFAESEFLAGVPEKLGGAICMQVPR